MHLHLRPLLIMSGPLRGLPHGFSGKMFCPSVRGDGPQRPSAGLTIANRSVAANDGL